MPLPGGLTPITVTGTFLRATGYSDTNGTAETGSVTFKQKYFIVDGVNNKILAPATVTRELDAAGSFSVILPATNNTVVSPTGWTYEVKVKLSTGVQTFNVTIDKDAAGATVDLADILPTDTPLVPVLYIPIAQRGAANGVATLDGSGLVPAAQLPVSGGGIPASLVDAKGDLIVATADGVVARLARGTDGQILSTNSAQTTGLEWVDESGGGAVASVNGETGIVVLTKTHVGLGSVDNTADASKPVSTAQQTALNLKANLASPTFTGTVAGITKAMVGLGSADNTADASKPISTAAQTALDAKADLVGGLVPTAQLPALAIGEVFTAANQAAMLALTAQRGDVALRTDTARTYILATDSPTTLADWKEVQAIGVVQSVNGQTGVVVLAKGDIGLGSVDNTSDAAKPISTATQTALDLKAPLASPTFTGTVAGVTKAHVGLSSVDNTADSAKPVSTAQQTALDAKVDESLVTTKGDLIAATGSAVLVRVGVGANGTALVANSAAAAGVSWGSPAAASPDPIAGKLGLTLLTLPEWGIRNKFGLTSGTFVAVLVRAGADATLTHLASWVMTGGTTPSGDCAMGLYTEAGVLIENTEDLGTIFATTGWREGALDVSTPVTAGTNYYLAALMHFSGGNPELAAQDTFGSADMIPINGHYPSVFITGQTSLPASFTPSSATKNTGTYMLGAR